MRRKSADRSAWPLVLARRFLARRIDSPAYHGSITLFHFEQIREPLEVFFAGERVRIVDQGYDWLQYFPDGAHYSLLCAFDTQGELVQWYIDIVGRMGCDEQGIPWYEDLYLDIVVAPDGRTLLLDVDELDEALEQGKLLPALYDFVWREASTLLTALEEDLFPLLWLCGMHREQLLAELETE